MKKYLFIAIIALISVRAFSQDIRFTVIIDPKISWMSSDWKSANNDGSKFGVNIGLNVDNFFAQNYALMTGISIDNTGGNLKFENQKDLKTGSGTEVLDPGSIVHYKLQYINIPLGLKLKTNEIGYWTFFTHLGLNGGVNIKATAEVDDFELENKNISDEVRLFNLGYFIGAGVEYSIGGNAAIALGLTYTNGFIDITDGGDSKVTLSDFAIRIGVLF
ncbi:MAG: porin family protein [Bacteroidales bacterium]|jgi:opacity protein-like surface antigen|nr:porin family protein [Bacteroidales bacterium]